MNVARPQERRCHRRAYATIRHTDLAPAWMTPLPLRPPVRSPKRRQPDGCSAMVQVRAAAADGSEVSSQVLSRVSLPTDNDAADRGPAGADGGLPAQRAEERVEMVPRFRGRSCPYLLPVRDPLRPSADPGCRAVDGVDRAGPGVGGAGPVRRRCHRVRRPPVPAQDPGGLVVHGRRGTAFHHRGHHLQVLAPDHGPEQHPLPVVYRCHLHRHVPGIGGGFSLAGPLQGTGGRPCQPAGRPHHHRRGRLAVLDLPDRAERPGSGRPARPVHSRRLPPGRHPSAGHAGPSLERRRVAHDGRPAPGHRDARDPGGRLGIRSGRSAHGLELARRQPVRPGLDPLLYLLGSGCAPPFHEGAV